MISVVIPVLNAAKYLPRCLKALADQKHEDVEFIFVDNGSKDGSAMIIREFMRKNAELKIKILTEKQPGASASRNKGAQKSDGDWIAFTDADCIADPNWLADLYNAAQTDPGLGALAGCIMPFPTKNIFARFLGLYTLPANREERVYRSFTLIQGGFPTANLTVSKAVFKKVGGFDVSIPIYGEDHDLCAKIYETGFGIKTLTNALVYHNHRKNILSLIKQAYGFGKSHAYSLRKLVAGAFIFSMPWLNIQKFKAGIRFWCDCNQADKKFIFSLILGFLWWPLWPLVMAYFLYIGNAIFQRGRLYNIPIAVYEVPVFVSLLLLKSVSITCGRIAGSMRYSVICI
jgi:glycosyltransferase involved in cell wall biosynthesis